ncbi:MAG: Omp28-related outer membrane protein, partial [Bacteroidota bacterium]
MKNIFCITLFILGAKLSLFGQTITSTTGNNKNILIETAIGSNLGFSPDAYCIQSGLEQNNPQLIIINNHNTPFGAVPLRYLAIDQWVSTYITAFPLATIDRAPYNNSIPQARNNWQAAINNRGTSASYQVTMNVEQTGQSFNVQLIGKALTNLFGEYRFNVIVVEDSVIQNQLNNYSSGNCPFMSSGNPILNFPHKNVLRAYLGTEWGLFKCNNPSANQLDTMSFSYVIPVNFNKKNLKLIGIIQKYDTNSGQREIMNSLSISLNSIKTTNITGSYLYSNFKNTRVGITLNNQQTNGSSYRRIQILPNNNVGVTWTTSSDASPFIGRGTGYNRFNGNNWIKQDTTATRIELQRSGFPSYAFNPTTNEEIVLSHIVTSNGYSGGFVLSRKNVAATTWNQSTVLDTIATVPGLLWCRTAVSNNYLHVVACYTDSSQNQPNRVVRNGVRTPVVYSRLNLSTNIWEVKTVTLPSYNSTRYYNGLSDSYSIDAGGNNVAILIGCPGQDLSLWKSGNNGTSWSKTIIDTFYQSPFIENSTIVDPAILSTDNQLHVLLDNSGNSHCFWTQLAFTNPDINDGAWSYFPSNSNQQLKYWKEGTSLNNKSTIATFNGDPVNVTNWQNFVNGSNSRYGTSYYISHPNAGISSDGKIYCIYSSPTEGENNIGTRDIYVVYSTNSGQTWSNPKNLTSLLGSGLEQAFPSIARTVNDKIHIVYSQSASVGPSTAGQWDINYFTVDTGSLDFGDSLYAQEVSFAMSDTILCKGNVISYLINNAKLYINDTLIASGNVTNGIYTPQSNINIKIKSIDGLITFKSFNIIVIDSLNIQTVFNGSNFTLNQTSICGINKAFQLGVTTPYTGGKTITWKLNSNTLYNRTALIDTFTQGGIYRLTLTT